MFLFLPTADPADDLVFDDEDTYAPGADLHPVAKAAADARGAAHRNREYRARVADRTTLDLVLVHAMVSAQMHTRDAERHRSGSAQTMPPPVLLSAIMRYAYRELRCRGWEKTKAVEALESRLAPKRPYLPAL